MDARLVAVDASPLIGLAAAGAFDLLRRLFGTVTVTAVVRDEVLAGDGLPGAAELAEAVRAGWIEVIDADADTALLATSTRERPARSRWRQNTAPCLVVMDEALGRWHTNARGLEVTGLAGVLIAAHRAGFMAGVCPYLDRLEKSDFRLSDAVVQAVLGQTEETARPERACVQSGADARRATCRAT
jgi:predicted nucleic acid-binding protein